jgi:hypothetical protein
MIKKLNQYLLTHYPLVWNTRLVWVLAANLILYLLFFLGGFASVAASNMQYYYSVYSVMNGNVFTFSVLCSIVVIVLWLVFYLRNNAFKHFYAIDRQHLVKEFFIIFIIVLSSILYYEAYYSGVKIRAGLITSEAQLEKEKAIVNLASCFVPTDKADYFILNSCAHLDDKHMAYYNSSTDYFDKTSSNYNDTEFVRIREALNDTATAFTYDNYCKLVLNSYNPNTYDLAHSFKEKPDERQELNKRIRKWLAGGNRDSVKNILTAYFSICEKYNINKKINLAELVSLPFSTPTHAIIKVLPRAEYSEEYRVNSA